MGPERAGNERVRAWVLVQATAVAGMAAKLRNLDKKKNDFVVIRADEVVAEPAGLAYNMVVAVDAESEPALQGVVADIGRLSGGNPVALRVVEHSPKPPHHASGFITHQEAQDGARMPVKVGRQDSSPGYNPWG